MSFKQAITAILIAAALAAALVGCGKTHGNTAQAKASISALAKNPKVVAAENEWRPVVQQCATGRHWLTHPIGSTKATVDCAGKDLTPAQRKAAEKCAETAAIHNGVGHGKLAEDENSGIACLATVAPHAKVHK